MGCEEFREKLELVSSLEDKDPSLQSTIAHVKECWECAEVFSDISKLDDVMQEKMMDVEVPPFLATRLKAGLFQRAASSQSPRWQWAYALSAFLFIGAFVCYNQIKIMSRLDHLSGLVSQHEVNLPSPTPINSPVGSQVSAKVNLIPSHNAILQRIADEAFKRHRIILASKFVVFDNNKINKGFQDKFNFPLLLPNFSKDLKLVGGSKCHSCVYEMAYLLYREGRNSVSLCIFPDAEFGLSQWQGEPLTLQKNGHNIAIWKKQHSVYALVFKLPVNEVRSLVWDLQQKQ